MATPQNNVDDEKKALRRAMRAARKTVSPVQREHAAQQLTKLVLTHWPKHHICAYVAAGSEAPTMPLLRNLWNQGRSVILPLVREEHLRWCRITQESELRSGYRDIQEPNPSAPTSDLSVHRPWLCLVPGLAFTASGQRLGQGGGFYDRALHDLRLPSQKTPLNCCIAGVAFSCQMVDQIPVEAHDQQVDRVLVVDGGH